MDIDAIRAEKHEAEDKIAAILADLERDCGVIVKTVFVSRKYNVLAGEGPDDGDIREVVLMLQIK